MSVNNVFFNDGTSKSFHCKDSSINHAYFCLRLDTGRNMYIPLYSVKYVTEDIEEEITDK
jgi:hypothetical protein